MVIILVFIIFLIYYFEILRFKMYDIIDFFMLNLVNSIGEYLFFNIGLKGE